MGQILNVPRANDGVVPFVNLPKEALQSLMSSYQFHGEGWGVDFDQVSDIFNNAPFMVHKVGFTASELRHLFDEFDTDRNGLIDAFEMLVALALISAMDYIDKFNFCFACYDFDNSGMLSKDEVVLLIRSAVKGLCKICDVPEPASDDLDQATSIIFADIDRSGDNKISVFEFQTHAILQPVVASWIRAFSNVQQGVIVPKLPVNDLDVNGMVFHVVQEGGGEKGILSRSKLDANPLIASGTYRHISAGNTPKGGANAAGAGRSNGLFGGFFGSKKNTPETVSEGNEALGDASTHANGLAVERVPGVETVAGGPKLPWGERADLCRPEEVPPSRRDPPEDVVQPLWLHGCRASDVRNNVKYGPKNSILFFTSAIAVRMHKDVADPNDEAATEGATGLWQQKFMFDHDAPITCIDYCPATNMCATADCTDGALGVSKDGTASQRESRIVFWNASSVEPHGTIDVQQCAGIRYLDFSIDGSRILALANDEHNTLMIFDTTRKALIYSVILGKGKVMAVSFAKVASMFCVASSIGTEFFLEDIGMYGAKEGVTSYTRYPALFHATGEPVRSSLTFSLSDSEFEDEMISGTADGAMVLWRGKSCISLLVGAHEGPITSIHYNKHCKLIVSGGTDGKVKMYRIVDPASIKLTRKGTLKISGRNAVSTAPTTRYLEIIASIDILIGDVLSKLVRSVNLSDDGTKVVVSTRSGEISEFAVTGAIKSKMDEIISPVAVEGAEGEEGGTSAPPATDGEEGEKVRYIGDDINGGPIIKSHWDNCLTQFGETRITGLCKIPVGNGGGFLSCGNDFTVRRWQAADGSDHKETKRYVFDAGCAGMGASGTHVAVYFDGTGNAIRSKELHILAIEAFHTQQVIHDLPDAISVVQFSADGSHIAVGFSSGLVIIYNAVEGQPYNEKTRLSSGTSAVFKIDFSADGVYIRVAYSDETLVYYDIMTNIGNSPAEAEVMRAIQWYTHSVPFTWDNKGAFSEVAADEAILCVDRSNHLVISALSSGAIMLTRLPNTGVIEPGTKVFRAVKQEAHCGKISAICYIDDGAKLVTAGATDGLIQVWKVTYDFDEGEPDSEIKEQEEPEVDEEGNPIKKKAKKKNPYDSGEDEDLLDGEAMAIPEQRNPESQQLMGGNGYDWLDEWLAGVGKSADDALWQQQQTAVPDAEMSLDWIYGYSGRITRASVRYSVDGNVVYPASTVGVIYDKRTHTQLHAMHHQRDISCLDVHPTNGLAVTGQRGQDSIFVCVWDTRTTECKRRLDCGRVFGASAVAMSPDGALVAVACQDPAHSILIFDWENNVLRARLSGGPLKILNLCFSLSPATYSTSLRLIQGGVGHYQLLDLKGRQLTAKRGLYGAGSPKNSILCSAALPMAPGNESANEFIVGMSDGSIGIVSRNDRKFSNTIPLTKRGVTAIFVTKTDKEDAPFMVVTGSVDGHIRVLDHEFQILKEYNAYIVNQSLVKMGMPRGIKSICVDKANRKILYGTAGGEIGEIGLYDGLDVNKGSLVASHCRDFVSGLSPHPLRAECATVGGDKTLRIWNLEKHTMMTLLDLPDVATSVCYAPNAQLIAVGLGGSVLGEDRMPRFKEGTLLVASYLQGSLRTIFQSKDAKAVITSMVFAPDGSELYCASDDGNIYVYDVLDDMRMIETLSFHQAGVKRIDVSEDGVYLCSGDANNVIGLWNIEAYKPILGDQKNELFPKIDWKNRSVITGLDSLGIFQPMLSPSLVSSLARSNDKSLVVTGDTGGTVSLFNYPCPKPGAPFKEFFGHSQGGVSAVSFSFEDQFILSTGYDDKCLFQWKVMKPPVASMTDIAASRQQAEAAAMKRLEKDALTHNWQHHNFLLDCAEAETLSSQVEVKSAVNNVEFAKEATTSPPASHAEIAGVLGMGGVAFVNGVKAPLPAALYCWGGQIATSLGSVVYAYGSDRFSQAIWPNPDGIEVGAIAVSNDTRYIFVSEKPSLGADRDEDSLFHSRQRIYAASTGSLVKMLPGTIVAGVSRAAFSHDDSFIACLAYDALHSVTMFQTAQGTWKDAIRLFVSQIDPIPITLLAFMVPPPPGDASTQDNLFQFATGGEGALRFWRLRGRNATSCLHEVPPSKLAPMTAMVSMLPGQLITGDSKGQLTLWMGKDMIRTTDPAHEGPISTMVRFDSRKLGVGIITGSTDMVIAWNSRLDPVIRYKISDLLGKVRRSMQPNSSVSSIAVDSNFRRLLVTLESSFMLEIAVDSGAVLLVTEAHSLGRLNAMAAHPTNPKLLITAGADSLFRVWNAASRRVIACENLHHEATAVAFSTDGSIAAVGVVGTENGGASVIIMRFDANSTVENIISVTDRIHNVGTGRISCVRFSPDAKLVAAASSDHKIYVFGTDKGFKLKAMISVFSGPVLSFDFSKSGNYLRAFSRVVSEAKVEMHLFDMNKLTESRLLSGNSVPTYALIKDEASLKLLVNETWATVSAAAPEVRGSRVINESRPRVGLDDVCVAGNLCLASYSDGIAKLFRFPPASLGAEGELMRGHSVGGSRCALSCDGTIAFVAGAVEGSVLMYNIKK